MLKVVLIISYLWIFIFTSFGQVIKKDAPFRIRYDTTKLNKRDSIYLIKSDSININFATGFDRTVDVNIQIGSFEINKKLIIRESNGGMLGLIKLPPLTDSDTIKVIFNSKERIIFPDICNYHFIYIDLIDTKVERYYDILYANKWQGYR